MVVSRDGSGELICPVCGKERALENPVDPFQRRHEATKFGNRRPAMPSVVTFEPIDTNIPGTTLLRARVPGGWLVAVQPSGTNMGGEALPVTGLHFISKDAWPA